MESGADVEARVGEVRASERSARMVLVVWLCESFGLCVARFAVVSSTGSVSRRHDVLVESSSADVEARMALRDIAPLLLEIHPHNH